MKWLIFNISLVNLIIRVIEGAKTLSEPRLSVTKPGSSAEVSYFKNGETLIFNCSDLYNNTVQIEVSTDDDLIFKTFDAKKESLERYTMKFTIPTVTVTCYAVHQNERISQIKKTLERVEDDPEKPSNGTENHIQQSALVEFFNDKANMMWLAVGGGICVVIILVVGIVKAVKKGKREEDMIQRASVNYEHFINESQAPTPPFPRGAKLEQTYLAPLDLMESPYATSRPQEADTYALPYTPSTVEELYSKPEPKKSRINALYTQVVPKSLRKDQNSSKYVNSGINEELNYAEIGHKNMDASKQTYANLGDKTKNNIAEDNYATVMHGSQDYANLNKDNKTNDVKGKPNDQYTNVFNNDPYVNAKREDYAEPSYCELSRKH